MNSLWYNVVSFKNGSPRYWCKGGLCTIHVSKMEVLDIDVKGDCYTYSPWFFHLHLAMNSLWYNVVSFKNGSPRYWCKGGLYNPWYKIAPCGMIKVFWIELIFPPAFSEEQSLIQCSQFQKWKSSKLMCFDFGLLRLFGNKSARPGSF